MASRDTVRRLLVAALVVMVVLSGAAGVADAGTSTGPTVATPAGETQGGVPTIAGTDSDLWGTGGGVTPLVSELVVRASLNGEVILRAGFFEAVTLLNGTYNSSSGVADFDSSFDANITDTGGEFSIRGQVIGTIDATRALFTFERYATSEGWSETPQATTSVSAAVGSVSGPSTFGAPDTHPDSGSPGQISAPDSGSPGQISAAGSGASVASAPEVDSASLLLQVSPWRRLGISFMDFYWILATLLLGLVLVGALPRFSRRVAYLGASEPLRTGGAGLVVVLLTPVVLLILGLSLFGIPVALAGAAVYIVLGWVGAVYGRFTIGMWLLAAIPRGLAYAGVDTGPVENRWAGLLVGSFLVGLIALVPTVGPAFDGLVVLLGLGAVTRLAYESYRRTERDMQPGAQAGGITASDRE